MMVALIPCFSYHIISVIAVEVVKCVMVWNTVFIGHDCVKLQFDT